MKSKLIWSDQSINEDGAKCPINAIAFKPDGTQLIVATGKKLLLYDAKHGDIINQNLRGHKDTIYCVTYSHDGKRFASGGADKVVIVWTSQGHGRIKYPHSDSIQCLAFNPVTQQLASCTESDFGLWAPDEKTVSKKTVKSKILCCSWTNDGTHLALGLFDGTISIRDNSGNERVSIKRNAPIWCLSWNPSRDEPYDILAVGCWDQTLSFYSLSGKSEGKERKLGFDPCAMTYFSNGQFLCIGGSDNRVTLWTKTGIKLVPITEKDDWVMTVAQSPNQSVVAVGTNDGLVEVYKLNFTLVHGLHQNHYIYRDFMTNVIIQDLVHDRRMKIKCNDYVKKLAVFKDRIAVQQPERICIYEKISKSDSEDELRYKLKYKINKKLECSLLVVTSHNIIQCLDKRLQMYDFNGLKEREWNLESEIRYIKVVGGPPRKEALLVGLHNGTVLKVFIDNPFPIQLLKINASIRCLDLSESRLKLAVVDDKFNLIVYDLKNKKFLFQESNASSVAWNSEFEDMLCFSGNNGTLSIKTGTFPVYQQKFQGFVVGFQGSKIFCLNPLEYNSMTTIDIPQSASLYRYLDVKDYENAYKIACLGVTEQDWRALAMQALMGLNFTIARKSFVRIHDSKYLSLLAKFERMKMQPKHNDLLFLAEIYAYQGKFDEAANMYLKAGHPEIALDMLCDLRMWEKARDFAQSCKDVNLSEILLRQAKSAEDDGDLRMASELYLAAKHYMKAINIMGENNWLEPLIQAVRSALDKKKHREELIRCTFWFTKYQNYTYAQEVYALLEDWEQLIRLYVRMEKWEDAFQILDSHPEYKTLVYLPYAEYLVLNDRFDEALEAYKHAQQQVMAQKMVQQLGHNAVTENRFKSASYYFFRLAVENLNIIAEEKEFNSLVQEKLDVFYNLYNKSKLYYAYHFIHQYTEIPFSAMDPRVLFNMCRFLLMNMVDDDIPIGISKVRIIFAIAKLATTLGCYKLAREAFGKLNGFRIPKKFVDEVELASIHINGKPVTNNEEMIPICMRCSATNPFLNNQGDCCVNCQHPFVRSFISFEHLNLVEFVLDTDLDEQQAIEILEKSGSRSAPTQFREEWTREGDSETLKLYNDDTEITQIGIKAARDPFTKAMMNIENGKGYKPVVVNAEMLKTFRKEEVFIVKWNCKFIPTKFYRCTFPEIAIFQCKNCNLFFHEDDYEFEMLKQGGCPFCHTLRK